jgi:iron(III) transport system substrate-binding protein
MPRAVMPNRPWVATRIIIFSGAYNTMLVKPAQAPKTYEDLLNPKWKGKLGIEGTDSNWFMTLVGALGEAKGIKLFQDIVAKNGISVRRGHSLLSNLVASGEVAIALTPYYHEVEPLKKAGAPVTQLYLSPVVAMPSAAAITKKAPHPYAAMLFLDFVLTDGQKIWAGRDTVPANMKYQHLPKGITLTMIDIPKYIDESAKWDKIFKAVLSGKRP